MRQQRQLIIMELYNNDIQNDSYEMLYTDILCPSSNQMLLSVQSSKWLLNATDHDVRKGKP